jgi:phosphatidyl-myo-inositol dimannoside synthase
MPLGPAVGLQRGGGMSLTTRRAGIRVVALVTDAFGGFGGIAQYNRDFLAALAQVNRVEWITVLPRFGDVSGQTLPAKLRQFPAVHNKLAYAAKALSKLPATGRVDVIYCGHINMMPVAVLLARLSGASLWLQIHGIDAWEQPSRLIQWSVSQADLVTAVSRYTRRRFLSWASVAPEKIKVLPNTIHDRFSPGPKSLALLDRFSLHGKKVLLTVSRLAASERYKGHDRVINALPRVLAICPDARYLVVGDGDDRPRLEDLAHRKGVADKVIFAGHVAEDELVDHFRLGDVFVMPSSGEGFGIVYLQAAACGTQLIAGKIDGSVDALADGALGRLVDPHDEHALADAIADALLAEPPPMEEALRRFRPDRFATGVEGLIRHAA